MYVAYANGSPCLVPSLDRLTFFIYEEYEMSIAGSIEGFLFTMFLKARFQFRELNAFLRLLVILNRNLFSRNAS